MNAGRSAKTAALQERATLLSRSMQLGLVCWRIQSRIHGDVILQWTPGISVLYIYGLKSRSDL